MHYVIGDIHGCYNDLIVLLQKINNEDPDAEFIFTGDWADRGPDVYKTLIWMSEHISKDGKYQSVLGNHDLDCIDWFMNCYIPWTKRTTNYKTLFPPETHYDFYQVVKNDFHHNIEELNSVMSAFGLMPTNKLVTVQSITGKTINYRIAHAWHPNTNGLSKDDIIFYNLFKRIYTGNIDNSNEILIHGHTPTISIDFRMFGDSSVDRPGLICYRKNEINVDGGCCFLPKFNQFACMLCAICLETLQEYYPYTIEERLQMGLDFTSNNNIDTPENMMDTYKHNIERYYNKKTDPNRQLLLKRLGIE